MHARLARLWRHVASLPAGCEGVGVDNNTKYEVLSVTIATTHVHESYGGKQVIGKLSVDI